MAGWVGKIESLIAERDVLQKRLNGYLESFPRVVEQRNAFERRCDDLEAERDALAMRLHSIRQIVTTDHETKGDFIRRVKSIMDADESFDFINRHEEAVTKAELKN